jgi:hypothetical protein
VPLSGQQTPDGTVAVVYVEADDPEAALSQFGSSDEPLNRYFRDQMKEVHGIDISQMTPEATKVHEIAL